LYQLSNLARPGIRDNTLPAESAAIPPGFSRLAKFPGLRRLKSSAAIRRQLPIRLTFLRVVQDYFTTVLETLAERVTVPSDATSRPVPL